MPKFYQYPKCSTCRQAQKWLETHSVAVTSVPIVDKPPSASMLKEVMKLSGLPIAKLFNTSGLSYREGGYKEKLKTMTEAEALKSLAADGKLIKRPLLVGEDYALIGFNQAEYEKRFA